GDLSRRRAVIKRHRPQIVCSCSGTIEEQRLSIMRDKSPHRILRAVQDADGRAAVRLRVWSERHFPYFTTNLISGGDEASSVSRQAQRTKGLRDVKGQS